MSLNTRLPQVASKSERSLTSDEVLKTEGWPEAMYWGNGSPDEAASVPFCLEVKLACLAPALFFSIMLNSSWGKWHRRTHLTNPDDQACVCTCNYGHANNIEQPRSSMSCSAM